MRVINLRSKLSMSLLVCSVLLFSQCQKETQEDAAAPGMELEATNKLAATTTAVSAPVTISKSAIVVEGGYAFKVRGVNAVPGDSGSQPTASTLRLYENGVELSPAHAVHEDIRNSGRGRYSHWSDVLYFSASDNSDPRTNGRTYTYTTGTATTTTTTTTTTTAPVAISTSAILLESGKAFIVKRINAGTGDSGTQPTISTLRLYENGRELSPAHAPHDDIRNYGGGRYSHWGDALYFSSSDNTDPRTNGRTYTYTTGTASTTTTTTTAPAPTPTPTSELIGYAAVNGTTTGGAGGQTVTVSTLSALKSAAGSSSPMIIYVSGTITGTGSVVVKSNKSIIGLSGATLNGVGLRIFGTSTSAYVKNVIVKNLKIKNVIQVDPATGSGDNDCIGLKYADHVWVDHCELSADLNHSDWEYYDGLIDISKQSDYITVSWSKLMNSWKGSFVGGTSDAGTNKLHVTFHHNFFNNLAERGPAFIYSTSHVFNNYYLKSANTGGYAVGSRYSSKVLVENNYFESISNPIRTDIESNVGYVSKVSSNYFKSSGAPRVTTSDPNVTVPYSYSAYLTPAADVASVVLAGAGAK